MKDVAAELQSSLFGNPHSRHFPSDTSTQMIESIRQRVLEHFNTEAEEYDLIFTSGATQALKIVGESFHWNESSELLHNGINSVVSQDNTQEQINQKAQNTESSRKNKVREPNQGAFVYARENHTSVLGVRDLAHQAGVPVYCLRTKDLQDILKNDSAIPLSDTEFHLPVYNGTDAVEQSPSGESRPRDVAGTNWERCTERKNCLFAYSAQCNFSGTKAPLEWIEKVQNGALNKILNSCPINNKVSSKDNTSDPNWFVLLDAAGLVATCPLDLSKWKPDFIPISFYKLFGYPTGLGCLMVRKRAWNVLKKEYFGGGTVLMVDSRKMMLVPRPKLHDRFEDGTLPFLSILALRHGFGTIIKLTGGMEKVKHHVFHLARYTHHSLKSYRHANGSPVAQLYCQEKPWHVNTHGSIVNFNLLNSDGSHVGYAQVERVSSLYNIYLRTGCLCNPGACQTYLDISQENLLHQFQAGHVCGDAQDLVDGLPTGSVRVSFGYMSSYSDADLLLKMVQECFVDGPLIVDLSWMEKSALLPSMFYEDSAIPKGNLVNGWKVDKISKSLTVKEKCVITEAFYGNEERQISEKGFNHSHSKHNLMQEYELLNTKKIQNSYIGRESSNCRPARLSLTNIVIFPVKSCGGLSMQKWNIDLKGLKYDRRWMVVTSSGMTLTQKRLPRMTLITPHLDLEAGTLTLSYKGEKDVTVPLEPCVSAARDISVCGGRVCRDRVKGLDCGLQVGIWLSNVLGQPDLRLMQQTSERLSKLKSIIHGESEANLSLANESQYLVIHRPSVRKLLEEIQRKSSIEMTEEELVRRFRGNLVIDGGDPYEEDSWTSIVIDNLQFQIQGGCRRCQMVCVIPDTGERTREPMLTLSATRGSSMAFGVHAKALFPATADISGIICVGEPVTSSTSNTENGKTQ
ncbi:molybdenum cofactor sulfurase isoform X2 [Procambarus clarkii]